MAISEGTKRRARELKRELKRRWPGVEWRVTTRTHGSEEVIMTGFYGEEPHIVWEDVREAIDSFLPVLRPTEYTK